MAGRGMTQDIFWMISNDHDALTHLYTQQPRLLTRHYADVLPYTILPNVHIIFIFINSQRFIITKQRFPTEKVKKCQGEPHIRPSFRLRSTQSAVHCHFRLNFIKNMYRRRKRRIQTLHNVTSDEKFNGNVYSLTKVHVPYWHRVEKKMQINM